MSSSDSSPWLLDSETGEKLAQASAEGSDTTLPEGFKWVWCLDARIEPYNELELEVVLARAHRNRKRYILVNADQLPAPASAKVETAADDEDASE